jgi:hypothetical protein
VLEARLKGQPLVVTGHADTVESAVAEAIDKMKATTRALTRLNQWGMSTNNQSVKGDNKRPYHLKKNALLIKKR